MYDYSRHSSPDTSFAGSSFIQHQGAVNLYTTLWDKYPVVFHTGTLQTNIPYIRNYVDASVQFDRKEYGASRLSHLQDLITQRELQARRRDSLLYDSAVNRFNNRQALSEWLNSDKQLQQLIASNDLLERYRASLKQPALPSIPQLGTGRPASPAQATEDSSALNAMKEIGKIKGSLQNPSLEQALSSSGNKQDSTSEPPSMDKLRKAVQFIKEYAGKLADFQKAGKQQDSLEQKYDSSRNALKSHRDSVERLINSGDIAALEKQYPDTDKETRNLRWLMGIRQLSLGRSSVDYTQLSAKNISLTGINVEYYDRYYFAFAAGKVDFRYLNFLTASATPNQYLILGRAGIGKPEGRHLYFTLYAGSKQASYTNTNNTPATNKLTGITLEGRFPIDRNTYITGEVAKSSYPAYIASGAAPGKLLGFSDRSNEAYSIQLYSYIPSTDTRLYGVYNRMGVYFQSFNIFNNNANASSWQVKADQYLWKKKLLASASVKKNDFTTPYAVNNYKSQTIFYSLLVSLRLPKWPVFTAGFMPYSQLTVINGQIVENRFYTLMGSANYAYRFKGLFMSSSAVYTRYFNSSNQTGFILYNAQSWFFNHSVMLKQFTLNGSASITHSPGYYLFSAGPGVQWKVCKTLSVGAGAKYNNLNNVNKPLGYNGNMDWQIGRPGRINISYERGYLPGQDNHLFRNDWGRATYTKNF